MDVGTATDTGGWKFGGGPVVIDTLFDVAPIVCGDCVFCFCFCNALLTCSTLSSFAIVLARKRVLVARL